MPTSSSNLEPNTLHLDTLVGIVGIISITIVYIILMCLL